MDEETKKLIQEQYAKLPKQLQDAIQSSHVKEQIAAIAQTRKLHIDQLDPFENEVMLVMMGFTDPIEFVGELKNTLSIDAETAQLVASDVNQHILLPIRDAMENGESFAPPEPPKVLPAIASAPVPPPMVEPKSVVMPSSIKPLADIKPPTAPSAPTAPVAPLQGSGPVSKPNSAEALLGKPVSAPSILPPMSAPKPAMPPVVTSVAPTTPVAPIVDKVLSQPTVSAAPKQPVVIADTKPAAPATAAPAQPTPPPPPPAHKIDPYREPVD